MIGWRFHRTLKASVLFAWAALFGVLAVAVSPWARADAALSYGYGICDKFAAGRGFPEVMGDVRADFNTSDDFQASYLISQAVNELCPAQIWQLRNTAAHYQSPPGVTP